MSDEKINWRCETTVRKYHGDVDPDEATPFEERTVVGNALMYGGASALWDTLIGAGNVDVFDATNAHLGVGDGQDAGDQEDQDLLGTNTFLQAMDGGYPDHDDATDVTGSQVTFRATYATTEANFAWNEWGLFNAASAGRMLNRRVEALGLKANTQTWTLTVVLSAA